jgi:hypothetical protein
LVSVCTTRFAAERKYKEGAVGPGVKKVGGCRREGSGAAGSREKWAAGGGEQVMEQAGKGEVGGDPHASYRKVYFCTCRATWHGQNAGGGFQVSLGPLEASIILRLYRVLRAMFRRYEREAIHCSTHVLLFCSILLSPNGCVLGFQAWGRENVGRKYILATDAGISAGHLVFWADMGQNS